MTKSRNINRPRARWTPEMDAKLRSLYPDNSTEVVAELLGGTASQVYSRAYALGIKKNTAFLSSTMSGRMQQGKKLPSMTATQFPPGHVPWNKGTHFKAGGRSATTQFKPGSQPHTAQPIGAYRLVREKTGAVHLERKTSNTQGANHMRWTPVSRLVWMAAHGPVPKGHLVVFKKGQQTAVLEEITLDRVECISRAEHAARNHPNRSNPALAKLYQLKGAITRQVNRINNQNHATQATQTTESNPTP